ncbi:hypothetical protein [Dolosicoccus paucivorans]|uniref:Uncharacterized protein n=1 Tax=Dolosicoccus paucivorans TaxID=84521 RepID=A0A2N6SP84_9LACT|nr:hypothetical protein [Dolosicoccus paucivorans]PMB85112.1 hypothetical protein CJ206_00085 [Dolosicoccus paucivorans]PMC58914.1 hypothetical protein CJ205_01730 [Dolosicoccus paucivorans]
MLVHSKNKNQKIVLGLLSYTYDDQVSMEELTRRLEEYQADDQIDILLFKDEALLGSDNFIGLMIIEHIFPAQDDESGCPTVSILEASVVPSFDEAVISYQMFKELKRLYPQASIIGTLSLSDEITEWNRRYNEENNDHE